MQIPLLAIALSALAHVPSTSVEEFRVTDAETLLRFLPEDDSLLILEIERGILEAEPDPWDQDGNLVSLRTLASGRRVFPATGGWMGLDLDSLPPSEEPTPEGNFYQTTRRFLAEQLHMEEAGLFLEKDGRLSFFRLMRLKQFRRAIAMVNAVVDEGAREPDDADDPFTPGFPEFDDETHELVRLAASKDHAWLSIEGRAVVLDYPMTSHNAARCISWLIGPERQHSKNKQSMRQLMEQSTSLEVTGGHARLRFFSDEQPAIHLVLHSSTPGSGAALIESLRKDGVTLGDADAPAKALAKFDPTPIAKDHKK